MTGAAPFPGDFPGTIGAPPDVVGLIRSAETICVADIETVIPAGDVTYDVRGGPVLFHRQRATARVKRTVKGVIPGDLVEVEFLVPDIPPSFAMLSPGETAVLFLRAGGDGYQLADAMNGKLTVGEESRDAIREAVGSSEGEFAEIARSLLEAAG